MLWVTRKMCDTPRQLHPSNMTNPILYLLYYTFLDALYEMRKIQSKTRMLRLITIGIPTTGALY